MPVTYISTNKRTTLLGWNSGDGTQAHNEHKYNTQSVHLWEPVDCNHFSFIHLLPTMTK